MEIPKHYQNSIKRLLKFIAIMLIIGVVSGFFTQELGRLVRGKEGIDLALENAVLLPSRLIHGHILTLGAVIPAVFIVCLIGLCAVKDYQKEQPIREKSLTVSLTMLQVGVLSSLLLSGVKAITLLFHVGKMLKSQTQIETTIHQLLDNALPIGFLPRLVVYAISHLLLGSALAMFATSVLKNLNSNEKKQK
mmetsp:Transcript_5269/g.8043  ORF Transcript_5269/g.8043 Transcript_5269/m.8043 type:complete len:192 (+) Transcript_5269:61-636(+)